MRSSDVQFLTCPADLSVSQLATRLGIGKYDVWLPLQAYVGARGKSESAVAIPDSTPMVLRDRATDELFANREDILMKLCMLDLHGPKGLSLAPSDVPPLFDLFLRWDKATGTKRVAAGTVVMHWALSDAQALAAGAIVSVPNAAKRTVEDDGQMSKKRRRRTEATPGSSQHGHGSVDGTTLADTVRGAHAADAFLEKAAEDLEHRLAEALASGPAASIAVADVNGSPQSQDTSSRARQATTIRAYAVGKIQQCKDLPPLHLLPASICSSSSLEMPTGVRWARPDPRILCRVFRGSNSAEVSAAATYGDASRQIAFFFVTDMLLPHTLSKLESEIEGGTAAAMQSEEVTVRAGKTIRAMKSYVDRGYRIVLLDHFPELHHGSTLSAEARLRPLVHLLKEECSGIASVTVLLSAMSYITAGQKRGISASLLLPNTGILQFFSAEMNSSLAVDTRASVVVGTRHREVSFLCDIHPTFAANAGMAFVEVDTTASGS